MTEARTIIVCSWQDCPFVADATTRFAREHGFTSRETEVLRCVIDGLDSAEIASRLVIASGTAKAHLHRMYQKCGVTGRQGLMQAFGAYGRR